MSDIDTAPKRKYKRKKKKKTSIKNPDRTFILETIKDIKTARSLSRNPAVNRILDGRLELLHDYETNLW